MHCTNLLLSQNFVLFLLFSFYHIPCYFCDARNDENVPFLLVGGGFVSRKGRYFFFILVGERFEKVPLGLGNYIRVMVGLLMSKSVLWWQHRQQSAFAGA